MFPMQNSSVCLRQAYKRPVIDTARPVIGTSEYGHIIFQSSNRPMCEARTDH